ncbi:hypothetical protein AO715_07675 [Xanthomonas sp. Mitacek01]|nr:hypothetical protein AO715_07675 [Xanthomonas sp. Mitacek01]
MRIRSSLFQSLAAVGACAMGCAALAAPPTQCPALADLPALHCVSNAQGWFYAGTPDAAADLAADASSVAMEFSRYFGRPAPRGAVIAAGTAQTISASTTDALKAAGATWQLPWLDGAERRDLQRSALEKQLRARLPDASDADIRARIDAAIPAQPATTQDATDRSALRHEIGHMALMRAFWPAPSAQAAAAGHYGGPGPDWLDELAAVLMESDTMADSRRALLGRPDASDHLRPLDVFFAQSHPMAAQLPALQAQATSEAGAGGRVRVLSGEAAQRLAGNARWFYAQARGVADFLLASSDDPAVFGSIAAFLADGGDMDGWLAAHGKRYGLPTTVAALGAAWTQWLAARGAQPATDVPQVR